MALGLGELIVVQHVEEVMEPSKLSDQIVDSVYSPELADVSFEIAELGLDELLDEGVLKDLPVIGIIVKCFKGAMDIRDRLFIIKVAKFLFKIRNAKEKDREKFRKKISIDAKLKRKVGDTLVLLLDRLDDLEKPDLIAKCFVCYLSDKITFGEFKRLSSAIDLAFLDDLKILSGSNIETDSFSPDYLSNLAKTGLAKLKVLNEWTNVGEVEYTISPLGELFVNIMTDSLF